ncbi:glycine--tRNA ligase subunit beta [Synechococcus sp. Nb3U1]|uniref:glycine--tRNA ligase subunit beta n=1 Tax=Synechococcus sp. Nb3U1 TaxID=1914529 RepID=UPI001F438584|nr:glycine--tRNA ligase subunit beta [Synechococcus sp. Nb3U1]MCF2971615.1 glycine--tRNA ligase subunit beta [Synechococcus sp. Nb3U1]
MDMVAYLLEVGCEELPASFVDSALQQWQTGIPASLAEAHLQAEQMQLFGTPRRLAVLLQGLPNQQPDRTLEVKGPPAQIAYQEGQLTATGEKFAQKQGVDPGSLEIRQVGKGSFVFAVQKVRGRPTAAVIQELAPGWITGLSGERLMRWACGDLKFPRPIRWLVSLWDDQVLPLLLPTHEGNTIPGLVAGRVSRGHRVLGPVAVTLKQAESYSQQMQAAGVSPDPAVRQAFIQEEVAQLATQVNGEAQIPPDLLREVVQLVEWPTAVLGRFEPEFLRLPAAVIETVMITHQRYFPVRDRRDPQKLLPYFITISNGDPEQSERIGAGNSRVVRARLSDARFFYEEDQRIPLAEKVERLEAVTFAEGLGSVRDKVERIRQISRLIATALNLAPQEQALVDRTAQLCKADLVTQMVYEFPELQGIMGADYARQDGEPEAVAEGIEQHYWPLGAGDTLPKALTGRVVGWADRLDTLVGMFRLGRIPTGSSDRFALRRAANSLVLIAWDAEWALDVNQLLQRLVQDYANGDAETLRALQEFLVQRLQTLLQEEKQIDYDLIKAVLGDPESLRAQDPQQTDLTLRALSNLPLTLLRAEYLQHLRATGELADLYPTLNRCARLAVQGNLGYEVVDPAAVIDPQQLQNPAELQLYEVCETVYRRGVEPALQGDFTPLVEALQEAAPQVAQFFEAVLVMDPDPICRANRLNLLGLLRNQSRLLGDMGAVVMAGE